MPAFFTRSTFGQPQPQVAQLPFSQFGGERPILPTDTTGGLPFPNLGQPQEESPLSPFMSPTGLSPLELQALMGNRFDDASFRGRPMQRSQFLDGSSLNFPQLREMTQQPVASSLPLGGIPFEGGGSVDKFNPVLAGGIPLNNINLAQSPLTPTATNPLNRNFSGGF